jgi:hypothetical protein
MTDSKTALIKRAAGYFQLSETDLTRNGAGTGENEQ